MLLSALLGFLLLGQASSVTPEQFFIGRTEGTGTVHVMLSGRHGVRDRSRGRMERGTLVLDQVVEEEGKPARNRQWRLSRSGANGITGTISDARGPVTGEVQGNRLHVTYRTREGYAVDQWITFNSDGRTASNQMTFRRMGVRVATLQETIRRVGD